MKRSKEKITLSILLAAVLVVGIVGYMIYVQHQFYTESTKNLLETYEQVDKTFTMFAQRNWNVLSEWGSNLQDDADTGKQHPIDAVRDGFAFFFGSVHDVSLFCGSSVPFPSQQYSTSPAKIP